MNQIKKYQEESKEYFYILWKQNGAFRLADFYDLESAENTANEWNQKGKNAIVITTNQLNQLNSLK